MNTQPALDLQGQGLREAAPLRLRMSASGRFRAPPPAHSYTICASPLSACAIQLARAASLG